jgi:hypothetical protein
MGAREIDALERLTYHWRYQAPNVIERPLCGTTRVSSPTVRIVAFVYMTIVSSLDGISRLIIVGGLVAIVVIIEKRAPKP